MEKEAYRQHFDLEENYWWFLGRKKAIRRFLHPALAENKDRKPHFILDVGCGTGGMLRFWEAFGKVLGIDISTEALRYCRMRHRPETLIQGSALHLPFPDETFDLVASCELLYHRWIPDDLAALQEFCRICRKGGYLLVTDSAFKCLKSAHDQFFYGARRYTKKQLASKVAKSGFSLVRISYTNMTLFPAIYFWRKFLQDAAGYDLKPLPGFLNRWLSRLIQLEAAWLKYGNLPFGTSLICLARKD